MADKIVAQIVEKMYGTPKGDAQPVGPEWIGDPELWHEFLCWNREGNMLVPMGSEYAVAQALCRMIARRYTMSPQR